MEKLANLIDDALKLAVEVELSLRCDGKASTLKDFKLKVSQPEIAVRVEKLRNTVEEFASKYPMPGF